MQWRKERENSGRFQPFQTLRSRESRSRKSENNPAEHVRLKEMGKIAMLLEGLLNQNRLNINCSIACMIHDREDLLERYDSVNLNCEVLITSEAVYAKLLGKGANINAGNVVVTDYEGEFVQLSGGTLEDGADYSGKFVIVSGDLLLKGRGVHAFENAESVVVAGTVYYPESCGQSLLSRVQGEKRPYPDGAYVLLGDRELPRILAEIPSDARSVWVAGEVSALEESALELAKARELRIACDRLLIYAKAQEVYGNLFGTSAPELVPEGFTVTGPLTLDETAALYGEKLYVRGALFMEEKACGCLQELQAILVKGCASLPSSCAKAFRAIGRADSYRIYEGNLVRINGWEYFSHERLKTMVDRGEKITLEINGFAVFGEDVTAEDMGAIAALNCNGFLILPGEAQGALDGKMSKINGFTMDSAAVQQMAGLSLEELIQKTIGKNFQGSNVNAEIYFLP